MICVRQAAIFPHVVSSRDGEEEASIALDVWRLISSGRENMAERGSLGG